MSIGKQNVKSLEKRVEVGAIPRLLRSRAEEPDILTHISPTERGSTTDISPMERDSISARGIVSEETAGNRFRVAWAMLITRHLCDNLVPMNVDSPLAKSDEQPNSKDPALSALAKRRVTHGVMRRADGLKPYVHARVQPKSSEKCSLIANIVPTNCRSVPRPSFGQPTLD